MPGPDKDQCGKASAVPCFPAGRLDGGRGEDGLFLIVILKSLGAGKEVYGLSVGFEVFQGDVQAKSLYVPCLPPA